MGEHYLHPAVTFHRHAGVDTHLPSVRGFAGFRHAVHDSGHNAVRHAFSHREHAAATSMAVVHSAGQMVYRRHAQTHDRAAARRFRDGRHRHHVTYGIGHRHRRGQEIQ